ncbi:MAG TPA: 30S ribosomal protein S11 [Candidatus Paceibacterota bacterium]|nr:30S ribosomal protein S11 [Candidatus Paceibacterota bacterium]
MGKKKVTTQAGDAAVKETKAPDATATKAASAASRKAKRVQEGKVYVNATYNNTVVTVTDNTGNVLAWASAGSLGFSGPKKATPFASSKVIAAITEKIQASGPKDISVIVKGIGSGRDSAIRSLINNGFNILSIKDATPVPHNGPRPAKVRRV